MPSTYTRNLGVEKIGSGEQSGSWGDTTNDNFDIIDRAVNGVLSLSISGTSSTLTTNDGVLSDGQYKVIVLTGSPSGTHTITISPADAQKMYMVENNTAQTVIFTQGSGGNVSIAAGDSAIIYANGAGAAAAVANLFDDLASSSIKITGGVITGITDLAVADGGTGTSTITGIVKGNGTSPFTAAVAGTDYLSPSSVGTTVQAYDAALQSISGLTTAADRMIYTTAADTYAVAPLTTFARSILDDADAATVRATIGVTIGTNVQAYDAGLQSISGLTTVADRMIYTTASDTYAVTTLTSFARTLLDDTSASTARTTLGLGTAATLNAGTSASNLVQLDGSARLPAVDGSQLTGLVSFPAGGIILWSGSVASIPSGWVLCDGLNGTPNLTDRFVIGAGSSYAVGATGGSATITDVPAHSHGVGNLANATGGSHTHNGNTSVTGAHTHNSNAFNAGNTSNNASYPYANQSGDNIGNSKLTGSSGDHSHTLTVNASGDHTHTISGDTGSTGVASVNILNPYYALAYIMKV